VQTPVLAEEGRRRRRRRSRRRRRRKKKKVGQGRGGPESILKKKKKKTQSKMKNTANKKRPIVHLSLDSIGLVGITSEQSTRNSCHIERSLFAANRETTGNHSPNCDLSWSGTSCRGYSVGKDRRHHRLTPSQADVIAG
jgi:hypothetical protein